MMAPFDVILQQTSEYIFPASIWPKEITLPIWVFIPLTVMTLPFWIWLMKKFRQRFSKPILNIGSYTQDEFFGLTWKWSSESEHIQILTCRCPKCSSNLSYVQEMHGESECEVVFHCDQCGEIKHERGTKKEIVDQVLRDIEQKSNSDEWKESLQRFGKPEKLD
jgi:hypothetical protein